MGVEEEKESFKSQKLVPCLEIRLRAILCSRRPKQRVQKAKLDINRSNHKLLNIGSALMVNFILNFFKNLILIIYNHLYLN